MWLAIRGIGILLIIFGVLDFCLWTFGSVDLTGVSWSPIACGVVGSLMLRVGSSDE